MKKKSSAILPVSFYQQPTLSVARNLLGKRLVRQLPSGEILSGMIVETEAYCGTEDKGCHASRGKTKRTTVMFGPAGRAYVYLIYGKYYCLNLVTEQPGGAVLIRSLDSLDTASPSRTTGPGRLCRYLQIDLSLNSWNVTLGGKLWVEENKNPPEQRICTSPRIGISYAQEDQDKPWRFFFADHQAVSKPKN